MELEQTLHTISWMFAVSLFAYGFAIILLALSIRQDRARARAGFVGAVQLSPELAAAGRARAAAESATE